MQLLKGCALFWAMSLIWWIYKWACYTLPRTCQGFSRSPESICFQFIKHIFPHLKIKVAKSTLRWARKRLTPLFSAPRQCGISLLNLATQVKYYHKWSWRVSHTHHHQSLKMKLEVVIHDAIHWKLIGVTGLDGCKKLSLTSASLRCHGHLKLAHEKWSPAPPVQLLSY